MKRVCVEKKSFISKLSKLIKFQMLALVILLLAFLLVSYRNVRGELNAVSDNLLLTYGRQLENRIVDAEKIFSRFLYGNTDLDLIRSSDEMTRHYASVRLQNNMADIMTLDTNAELLVVAEADYDLILDSGSLAISMNEKEILRNYVAGLSKGQNGATQWEVEELDGKMYLCKSSVQNGRAAAIFLSVDTLLENISNPEMEEREFLFTDKEGCIYEVAGRFWVEAEPGEFIDALSLRNTVKKSFDLQDGRFILFMYEKDTFFYEWMRNGMVILVILILMLYLFTAYLRKDIWKELIFPMGKLTENMERIQEGNYELRMDEMTNNLEFTMLTQTFNKLMDEIINLKIRNYEKRLELQEADQKYIRLQLRPHFFLNAMATVGSMSESGKNMEIQQYIQALSKNIRYMFSSGLHTVSVKEEIRHVDNYLKMQELKYPGCVFYYTELPEELEEWKIPQMLIHTLVENEYKYAIVRDETLMLLIKVSLTEHEGKEMLLIEIEDDGKGYPEEVIEYINGAGETHVSDGSRVGLWSIRRLLELMYDRKGLFHIENVQPHGALNRIYIPREVIHEIRRDDKPEDGVA